MSEILFPAGQTIELVNLDIETMSEYSKQWSIEQSQIQSGVFSGSMYAVHAPRIQIYHSHHSHGIMVRGEFPDNCVLIGYALSNSIISQYNETMKPNKITILTKGDEIDYFASEENSAYTLAIESDFFYQTFSNYFGQPFELHNTNKHFQIHESKIPQFLFSLNSWMNQLQIQYTTEAYKKIETEILGSIFETLNINIKYDIPSHYKAADIREILDNSIYDEFRSISDIALQVNLSERHMLRLFKDAFGISPKIYLQKLRLNAIRKELLSSTKTDSYSISDIALKYNFYHMGYFSAEYKKMFGELPSITTKR
jgi:AraC-like DNA-binding protein